MKNTKIAVAGHLCVDITPGFPQGKTRSISELLKPGKLLNVNSATVSTGGAVANTGLALKILGSDVILMGKIGNDSFGTIIEEVFEHYKVSEHLIHSDSEHSSYTIAIAPPGIDRIFLHHAGCNDTFSYEDLDFEQIRTATHFHFGYPSLMRKMYLDGGTRLVRIFQKVKELGLTTSLDMAAVEDGTEAGDQDWSQLIRNVLPYVDFFVPSVEELGYMIDRQRYDDWERRADGRDITSILNIEEDVKPLADKLIQWGARCVLIKCGAPGMYLRTASDMMTRVSPEYASWSNLSIFERSYVPERILSGTGAGDTSIAAFLKAAIDGYSPEDCLHLAAATGASCITAYDALSGLKSFHELLEHIHGGWAKQE